MIERLLAADAALDRGEVDHAERLFAQVVEADARNAIAVVGLARVARSRGSSKEARDLAQRALDIDPQEAAARRLLDELDELEASRAQPPPIAAARVPPRPGWRAWLARLLRRS